AKIVWSLLDGRAYTASELALVADVSPSSVSNHLSKLLQGEILKVDAQGRHRYYSFANPDVAYAVESLANLAGKKTSSKIETTTPVSEVKYCRTCYDHLAGKVGVLITERLLSHERIALQDTSFEVTAAGRTLFQEFGLDIGEIKKQRRHFAKPCLDWSERKYHLAGSLGAALFKQMLGLDWMRRTKNSRAILITATGREGLLQTFDVKV
ncbi:MAG: helix-turn-helix domain-containing protein, partial [Maribacter sp.]